MKNLKTKRSAGLYIALTVLMKLMPIFLLIAIVKRGADGVAGMMSGGYMGGGGILGGGPSLGDILGDILMFLIIALLLCLAYAAYQIILFWGVCRDINNVCGKYSIGNDSLNYIFVLLLSAVTLKIYYVFWSKQQGARIQEAQGKCHTKAKGSEKLHFVLSLLAGVSVWINAIFLILLRAKPEVIGKHLFLFLVLLVAGFILDFMDMANMAYFIVDANALVEACDGLPAVQGAGVAKTNEARRSPGAGMVDNDTSDGIIEGRKGTYEGAVIPVEGELVIGRDEGSCNLVIKRPEISRKHCGIRYAANGRYIVTDYSSNGVYYKNGQAFPRNVPVECSPGTIIVIAKSGNEFLLK